MLQYSSLHEELNNRLVNSKKTHLLLFEFQAIINSFTIDVDKKHLGDCLAITCNHRIGIFVLINNILHLLQRINVQSFLYKAFIGL